MGESWDARSVYWPYSLSQDGTELNLAGVPVADMFPHEDRYRKNFRTSVTCTVGEVFSGACELPALRGIEIGAGGTCSIRQGPVLSGARRKPVWPGSKFTTVQAPCITSKNEPASADRLHCPTYQL